MIARPPRWTTGEILLIIGGCILVLGGLLILAVSIVGAQLLRSELAKRHNELSLIHVASGRADSEDPAKTASRESLERLHHAYLEKLLQNSGSVEKRERRIQWLESNMPRSHDLEALRDQL